MVKTSMLSTHQHEREENHEEFLPLSEREESATAHRPQSHPRRMYFAIVAIAAFAATALVGVAVPPALYLARGRSHPLTQLRSFSMQEIVTMVEQVDFNSALSYTSVDADGNPGVIKGSWDEAGDVVASRVALDVKNMTFVVGPRVEGADYLVVGTMVVRDDCPMGT